MSKATICNSSGNALEQVLDPSTTVRSVRKPDIEPCCLKVKCAEEATLVVEIDGEKVAKHVLRPGTTKILLSHLVPQSSFMQRLNSLRLLNLGKSHARRNEPQEFTVFVRRGNEDGRLLGTYSFKLMSEQAFDQAFDQYVRRIESKHVDEKFTTDESAVDSGHKCWNCRQPIASNTCCLECGCEPKDEPESGPQ